MGKITDTLKRLHNSCKALEPVRETIVEGVVEKVNEDVKETVDETLSLNSRLKNAMKKINNSESLPKWFTSSYDNLELTDRQKYVSLYAPNFDKHATLELAATDNSSLFGEFIFINNGYGTTSPIGNMALRTARQMGCKAENSPRNNNYWIFTDVGDRHAFLNRLDSNISEQISMMNSNKKHKLYEDDDPRLTEGFVIINDDGKILTHTGRFTYDFLDTVDDTDGGFSRAVIFENKRQVEEVQDTLPEGDYTFIPVSKAFNFVKDTETSDSDFPTKDEIVLQFKVLSDDYSRFDKELDSELEQYSVYMDREDLEIKEDEHPELGFTLVTISFKPYEDFTNRDLEDVEQGLESLGAYELKEVKGLN